MIHYKFEIGDSVRLRGRVTVASEQAKSFVVAQRMPVEHGAVTYRIKSEADKFERIADEADLSFINGEQLDR